MSMLDDAGYNTTRPQTTRVPGFRSVHNRAYWLANIMGMAERGFTVGIGGAEHL